MCSNFKQGLLQFAVAIVYFQVLFRGGKSTGLAGVLMETCCLFCLFCAVQVLIRILALRTAYCETVLGFAARCRNVFASSALLQDLTLHC